MSGGNAAQRVLRPSADSARFHGFVRHYRAHSDGGLNREPLLSLAASEFKPWLCFVKFVHILVCNVQ